MEADEKKDRKKSFYGSSKANKKLKRDADKEEKDEPELEPVPFLQLFRFTTTKDRLLLLLGTVSAFIASACFPVLNILFGLMAELMVVMETPEVICNGTVQIHPETSTANSLHDDEKMSEFLSDLSMFSTYLAIVGTIQLIFGYLFVTIFIRVAESQIYRIRQLYFDALLRQDVGWYDTVQDRNFVSKISEDIGKVQEAIGDKVGQSVYYSCSSVICLASSFWFGWKLTLVILATSPIIAIASTTIASLQSKLAVKEQQEYAKSGKTSQEALQNIKTVMAFGGQQTEITRYEKDLVFALAAGKRRGTVSAFGGGFLWFLNYASYSLAFWFGTKLIFDGRENMCAQESEYGTADMLIIFFNVLTGSFHIGHALSYLDVFSVGRGAAAAIYAVIDRTPDIDSYSDTGRNPSKRLVGKIDFKNIHFSYPSRSDVKVLNGLNLSVKPGTTVALVGNSGCGKSTCLQLLQRFYDPTNSDDGMVCVDDLDIRGFNLNWYRSQIGVVSQEPVLFNTTIAENIRYGRDDVSQEEIENACRLSNALTFISKLPNGFETVVGDRGASLSGGQKQRIALARALVRDPAILLLDEATSALDTASESIVQRALDEARKGRTTLIVAHRLSTIRSADLIVSLLDGKVFEMGTHKELLDKKGLYFSLVTTQMSDAQKDKEDVVNNESSPSSSATQKLSIAEARDEDLDIETSNYDDMVSDETGPKEGVVLRLMKMNMMEWPLISFGVIMSVGHGCILPLYAFFFGDFLGVLSYTDADAARDRANYYAFVFLFIGVAAGVTIFASMLCFSFAGEMLTNRLRKMAFATMMKQELGWYDNPKNSVGALCMRLAGDAASVQGATGSHLGTMVHAFTTIAISIGLALFVLPKLGAVALAFVPFILVAAFYSGILMENQQIEEKAATEEASKIAFQAVTNIRTVASLGKEKAFVKMYSEALLSPHLKALRNSHVTGFVYGLSQALMYYAYAAVMYYGGILIRDEDIPYTKVFIIGEALIWSMLMLGRTLAFAPNYHKAKVSGGRILRLLDRKSGMDTSAGTGLQLKNSQGSIIFDNVEFSYPTRPTAKILRGLNFGVEPGKKIAVVGPSGCGKSTCIQLILRFYDPASGTVKLDEVDVGAVNLNALRSQMAIVAQEPALFDRTLAENIAYGYSDDSREISMDDIIQAARQANIHNFISGLPAGYETRVGEMGSQLSGGQKQRLAIARALIRDPKVLLLDEATSALDTESEAIVQSALDAASTGRTSITIAHRLSSIQNADKILVVSNGVLCESGSHSELLEQRGIYYKLWKIQGRRD